MNQQFTSTLSEHEWDEIRWAYQRLEHPSLAARLSSMLAMPIEEGMKLMPRHWRRRVEWAGQASILQALNLAVASVGQTPSRGYNLLHKALAAGAGAVGGFFGPLALLAELPITTTLILRAIADIAQSEGEDLSRVESKVACVQVFALGGRTREDESADLGYYGLRITLGFHFENILEYAGKAEGPHIPAFVDLTRAIAARFGVVISDKTAAQMVPIVGAASGALLNLIFMQHYQDVARGHFIVRRLERDHGIDHIRDLYQQIEREAAEAEKEYSPVVGW